MKQPKTEILLNDMKNKGSSPKIVFAAQAMTVKSI